jgi:hypothetical protein
MEVHVLFDRKNPLKIGQEIRQSRDQAARKILSIGQGMSWSEIPPGTLEHGVNTTREIIMHIENKDDYWLTQHVKYCLVKVR